MEGKFINEIGEKAPDAGDLTLIWDLATGSTAQTTVEKLVGAGLPHGNEMADLLAWSNITNVWAPLPTSLVVQHGLPKGNAAGDLLSWSQTTQQWLPLQVAPLATALTSGVKGSVPYQDATDHTSMLAPGATNTVLAMGPDGVPQWVHEVELAALAFRAATVAGGSPGSIPVSGSDSMTHFLPKGTANQILAMDQTGTAPVWVNGNPPYTTANAGQFLGVKPDGTALEWRDATGGDVMVGWPDTGAVTVNSRTFAAVLSDSGKPNITSLTVKGLSFLRYGLFVGSGWLNLGKFPNATSFSFPDLIEAVSIADYSGTTKYTSLSLPSLKRVSFIALSKSPALTLLQLDQLIFCGSVEITNATALTGVTLGNGGISSMTGQLTITGAALPDYTVNGLINMLAAMDGTNGKSFWKSSVNLSGGTSAAPSGTAITAAQTLIARGATVTVNGTAITTTKRSATFNIPDYDNATDRGKILAVKADGSGLEWRA